MTVRFYILYTKVLNLRMAVLNLNRVNLNFFPHIIKSHHKI